MVTDSRFQAEDVFENVFFRIDTDWKLGLIGNHAGNSEYRGRTEKEGVARPKSLSAGPLVDLGRASQLHR